MWSSITTIVPDFILIIMLWAAQVEEAPTARRRRIPGALEKELLSATTTSSAPDAAPSHLPATAQSVQTTLYASETTAISAETENLSIKPMPSAKTTTGMIRDFFQRKTPKGCRLSRFCYYVVNGCFNCVYSR